MRMQVQCLALLSGLRILPYCELWCRLQTKLGSGIAVAAVQAGSYSSDSTPSLGTSICRGFSPKKTLKKKKRRRRRGKHKSLITSNRAPWLISGLVWGKPGALCHTRQKEAITVHWGQEKKDQERSKTRSHQPKMGQSEYQLR